ncbi:MAG: hypothetical protein LKF87_12360 [Clostridium tyrobutyricum]|jgi:hypothetical protein|uniref:hypothetical protein n=1 Tax=Clostridium tyrobutyricum TaxID=1519 RepID=UPI00243210E5|nr:hypothetical protein [Clostridium tyrobutyricum]MCH4200151.1 hypothetical protein [Clostridium tyrobutyricum]MCH4237915.1 hypothetical protein [Clostridium tyrobutyricum]MCH4259719.1 hypothetical protein [Clostridium tyrobutyricum]
MLGMLKNKTKNQKNKLSEKQVRKDAKKTAIEREKSLQEWLPIYDVDRNFIKRRDGFLISAIKIHPLNIDLLSKREKRRIVKGLHEVINGIENYFEILTIGRPVDLDSYVATLQERMRNEEDYFKKKLLQFYIKDSISIAAQGETLERRFYILEKEKEGKFAEEELSSRIRELSNNLSAIDIKNDICQEEELINLLFIFLNPSEAAYEKTPQKLHLPTQFSGI